MNITFELKNLFDVHLQEKLANRNWLADCLEKKPESFPYTVFPSGKINMGRLNFISRNQPENLPSGCTNGLPTYLVNIPLGHLPGNNDYAPFQNILKLLKKEAFDTTPGRSKLEVQKRVAVVIGINQIVSIDPSKNTEFENYIFSIPRVNSIAYRVFGFFWPPKWQPTAAAAKFCYPKDKAFLLLKRLSTKAAEDVRLLREGSSQLSPGLKDQVPYQKIRERIKDFIDTVALADHFVQNSPQSPIYLSVMDADCSKLRTTTGIFSRYDTLITQNNNPSCLSLGYSLKDSEPPLRRLGVEIDMKVRQAMNSVINFGAYFPEPNSIFRIRKPGEKHHLLMLSFLGKGNELEYRRLVTNGLAKKIFERSAIFVADGGVTTEAPERMSTENNTTVTKLTTKTIKQKKNLMSLRGLSQSHAVQKKWADSLFFGLEFSCPQTTDATGPMMHIFSVFDPISRMYCEPGRFSATIFDKIMRNYSLPLSQGQLNTLNTARTKLYMLNMPADMTNKIQLAAQYSGQAIYQVLLNESTAK